MKEVVELGTLVRQEIFKLTRKKSTWISTGFLVAVEILFAILSKVYPKTFVPASTFESLYFARPIIIFYMIAATATIITMEFQFGTMKQVLYRRYSRGQILVSKWLAMLLYSVYWYILSLGVAMLLKLMLFRHQLSIHQSAGHGLSIFAQSLEVSAATFITLWLLLSLVFLLANLFTNSAAAVSVGIIGYFATNIVTQLLTMLIQKWDWTKWNPLTMLLYPQMLAHPGVYQPLLNMQAWQMLLGNVIYIALFLWAGYKVFTQRNL
ncbi:ABC superfamily ATP binding cassette transporter, membrane protein [Secundilactobacillus odoratitofui DSM 19909 = JCM 15043]|uniref:ABC superfamily ATP binding cassette transporter, membrane protein n=1 Tax=Secundilactobacillus odoratitofui DSM 19909 = JCM 15043 TaxID=1423776 RepID=A0A0R1M2N1_9LACO|nr:ABC superfamily ATP binding cassette transporter, membrane protein [Secundilactobacillus odoratitofui DSM 19909 = JCM 15043]